MGHAELLGRVVTLHVERLAPQGAYLGVADGDPRDAVLLPRREVPADLSVGDALEVFVYLDSQDRPVATLEGPRLALGEVAFLCVTDLTPIGAFVDWGLPKELLVPFAEQTRQLAVGDLVPIGLIHDRSGRLAGTMRVRELLDVGGAFERDEWVEGEAWREEPGIGVFVILERRFLALLPAREPHALRRGQRSSFRVSHVWPDGRVELSLRRHEHEERADDAARILAALRERREPVSEDASPDEIRSRFGLSKKAFKRAVGGLLKRGEVRLGPGRTLVPR